MALLKKSDASFVDTIMEELTGEPVITEEEVEAIKADEVRKRLLGANTERLELATGIVSNQFGLDDDYRVNKFDDKGKVVKLTLENSDFVIAVTIKDSERHGMYVG